MCEGYHQTTSNTSMKSRIRQINRTRIKQDIIFERIFSADIPTINSGGNPDQVTGAKARTFKNSLLQVGSTLRRGDPTRDRRESQCPEAWNSTSLGSALKQKIYFSLYIRLLKGPASGAIPLNAIQHDKRFHPLDCTK